MRFILQESDESMPTKLQNGALMIRKDVRRRYYFVRASVKEPQKVTGKPVKVRKEYKLGFVGEITKREAEQLRAKTLETINARLFVAQSQVLFKDLAAQFLAVRVPQLGVATQAKYEIQIRNHLVPCFGDEKLGEIDRLAVESFLNIKADTLGWWSRVDLKGILSAMFTAAKDWHLWDGENPTRGVRIGKKILVREKRLLKAEELRTLLGALVDRPKFIVLISFGLGLRISEVLGLRWADIDFDKQTIQVRRRWYRGDLSEENETKSSASTAQLWMCDSMLAEFRQRYPGPHKRSQFVFIGDDGQTPPDDRDMLREEFRPVLKRLGLYYKGFGWHAFRRQNITWRQTVGEATPLEAQKGARHASLDMTYLYTLTDTQRETAQQQKMFDYLMGLPGGEKPQ